MSHHAAVASNTFPGGGVQRSRDRIFVMVLTARVADGMNPLWRSPLFPGHAYPVSELSWRLCVFLW
jgi:hypothetical protein